MDRTQNVRGELGMCRGILDDGLDSMACNHVIRIRTASPLQIDGVCFLQWKVVPTFCSRHFPPEQ